MSSVALDKDEEELEDLFDEIDIPSEIREARMAAVHDAKLFLQKGGYGACDEISVEREILDLTANEKLCVVHFFHPEFRTCKIMQGHIDKLAHKHFRTRFLKFDITKGSWVAVRLKIRELPAVLCFVGGTIKNRIVGFDDLGGTENFPLERLEYKIAESGVIQLEQSQLPKKKDNRLFGYGKTADACLAESDDSDDDWN